MIIWVDFFQNYMFTVFFYCIFSFILNRMEINIHISIDEDTMIEPYAMSESRKVLWVVLNSLFFKEV